ncbi:hypothetical protein MicloDRAFT_00064860 [Microvirga lotononidis]|uniref:Uncharacterized protein n=1 Tax=Microvirga lotononidis TaxID=864069 RepID=I4YP67_9HYPH|nr:hypothetical protein MicloDRAFT_00064860 [Microvirga lotononidis]
MARFVFIAVLIIIGGAVMAAPKETPEFDPFRQVPNQEGGFRDQDAEPSQQEMRIWMWRRFVGDKPIPKHLQEKYGLPERLPPLPAGR